MVFKISLKNYANHFLVETYFFKTIKEKNVWSVVNLNIYFQFSRVFLFANIFLKLIIDFILTPSYNLGNFKTTYERLFIFIPCY